MYTQSVTQTGRNRGRKLGESPGDGAGDEGDGRATLTPNPDSISEPLPQFRGSFCRGGEQICPPGACHQRHHFVPQPLSCLSCTFWLRFQA